MQAWADVYLQPIPACPKDRTYLVKPTRRHAQGAAMQLREAKAWGLQDCTSMVFKPMACILRRRSSHWAGCIRK